MLQKQQQSQVSKENTSTQWYGFHLNLVHIRPLRVLQAIYIDSELWQYFICTE